MGAKQVSLARWHIHPGPSGCRLGPGGHSRSAVPNPVQPHGLQPASLLCPRDSAGKHTGVGSPALQPGRRFPREPDGPLSRALESPGQRPRPAPLCCASTQITPQLPGPRSQGASSQPSSGRSPVSSWPAASWAQGRGQEALRAATGPVGSAEPPRPAVGLAGRAPVSGRRASGKRTSRPCSSRAGRLGQVVLQAGTTGSSPPAGGLLS